MDVGNTEGLEGADDSKTYKGGGVFNSACEVSEVANGGTSDVPGVFFMHCVGTELILLSRDVIQVVDTIIGGVGVEVMDFVAAVAL